MMKPSSVSDLKKELENLPSAELVNLCLRLIKHKKDNKELVDYLLFESGDRNQFIKKVKEEIDLQFSEIKNMNLYFVRKSLRKILRIVNKYCKLIADKSAEAELNIYFCVKVKQSEIPYYGNAKLENLYKNQLKKSNSLIKKLHEDVRADFTRELEGLV